ncbi:patatin-like phospholipase family protein [Dokdonella sp.]|uniref:patatin-like phospholipase family protein n=1 Tax=Dokdonella sp. TaxID=2291710 RepID=UPI0031CAA5B3|nr:patatin-like phospholipase family protein [Dokdonella sp.]
MHAMATLVTSPNAFAAGPRRALPARAWRALRGSGRRWASGLLVITLMGCAHYPVNARLDQYAPTEGYRLENLAAADNSGSLFVVLAFSGGGTRAAALAYGVLEQLQHTDIVWEGRRKSLLDEVDLISAVSGGSYTAAYYALYRARLFTDFEQDFLRRNVQGQLTRKLLAPGNLARTISPTFGRSDLVAEYLDKLLFHGATFEDLQRQGRPFVLLNASDMSLGTRFEFSQDQFDLLCSDLASFPLARAVAASSAVPVVFSPLTLRNYAGSCGFREPAWVQEALDDRAASARRYDQARDMRSYLDRAQRPYVHLLDGGISDNTGLRALLERTPTERDRQQLTHALGVVALRKVVLITVSAETPPSRRLDRSEAVPSIFQVIRNVKDIPIGRYSFETTELFKARFEALAGASGNLDTSFYLAEVTFEALSDPIERQRFEDIPTSFALPAEDVDALRKVAGRLLRASPGYRRLLHDLAAQRGALGELGVAPATEQ